MAEHNELGKWGEEKAAAWLQQQGYVIIERNWRHRNHEIDIIAHDGKKLHFIEVKIRRSTRMGYPEESVTKKKFRYLKQAADEYLFRNPQHKWIQYDILSIVCPKGKAPSFFLLSDVYL
ncbi:YraN family protein [Nostoc ellipsosporum NOK]|jgi:putative endonuclease|nr:YraN family protein [Nostoc ellipsosporum NOK]